MRIHAFQGTRYANSGRHPGSLAAPPFDQIDEDLRDRLHAIPCNFAHLIRPLAGPDQDAHQHAVRLYQEWLVEGFLTQDLERSLYPYEIALAAGGRRLGLCALVGLEEPEAQVVRPHEKTVISTVEERLGLLRATQSDLEPILLLSDDAGELDLLLAPELETAPLLVRHQDGDGNKHRLYRIDDATRIRQYRELLDPCTALIADGHHRWEVARRYAAEVSASPDSPAGTKLAVITSLSSSALTIDPIHRGLSQLGEGSLLGDLLSSRSWWSGSSGRELAAAVGAAPQPAVGIWIAGQEPDIARLDPARAPNDLSPAARKLAVCLVHSTLLPNGNVVYRSDPDRLFSEVETGAMAAGIWLPPMSPDVFSTAVAEGVLLPPKSTRFLPKLASGLVWVSHGNELS